MSFTASIKNKISSNDSGCEYCRISKLAGLLRFAGRMCDGVYIISTENEKVAACAVRLFSECLGIKTDCEWAPKAKLFTIKLSEHQAQVVFAELFSDGAENEIMPFECCRRSFLAGAFLGGGEVSDPHRSYHLEFDSREERFALEVIKTLSGFDINAKLVKRKERSVVYIKDYESIAAVLGLIGADFAALELYSISVEKDIRNSVNRKVNCENANLDKLALAASKQIRAIMKIEKKTGLDAMPETLAEMARIRLMYPEDSLKELGARLDPPIGKSGVNHRLSRIMDFANKL